MKQIKESSMDFLPLALTPFSKNPSKTAKLIKKILRSKYSYNYLDYLSDIKAEVYLYEIDNTVLGVAGMVLGDHFNPKYKNVDLLDFFMAWIHEIIDDDGDINAKWFYSDEGIDEMLSYGIAEDPDAADLFYSLLSDYWNSLGK